VKLAVLNLTANLCISKEFVGRLNPVDLNLLTSDLDKCSNNYEETAKPYKILFESRTSQLQPRSAILEPSNSTKLPLALIIASLSAVLSICGVIIIFTFIRKTKVVVKDLKDGAGRESFEMFCGESSHYYTEPDTARWRWGQRQQVA
jgi:hypothetical protein